MVATTLPSLSTMSVFSVAFTAVVRLFCTSVLISTVLDDPELVARVGRRDPRAVPGDAQRIGDDHEHVSIDAAPGRCDRP